jgi:hypothetical protein
MGDHAQCDVMSHLLVALDKASKSIFIAQAR